MKPKLNKEVCQKCCEENDWPWDKYDEMYWKKGWVWCLFRLGRDPFEEPSKRIDEIPEGCPNIREAKKMKLCKKVCQKCYDENGNAWGKLEEQNWQEGDLWCVKNKGGIRLGKMSDECFYRLEQIIMGK